MAANSYRNVFLTNIESLLATGNSTVDLGIGELGIVDSRTSTSTTTPAFPTNRSIQIVQGNSDRKLPKGMLWGNQSLRSPEIPASSDIKFEVLKGQKAQNMIVTLGYDGIDPTKTMAPRKDKQLRVYLTLTGQPIANITANTGNHPASITETFDLILPCTDECVDSCGDTVDCNAVADAIIAQMQVRKTIGAVNLIDGVDGNPGLVKLTKLSSCDTPSGLPTSTCTKYEITVPDLGDQTALGLVQAQYPGQTVTRLSRSGVYSTYQAIYCSSSPSDYSTATTTVPNCTTCPSGGTLVATANVFTIVTDGNLTAASIAGTYAGVIVTDSTIKLSTDGGKSTFQIYSASDLATVAAVVTTDIVTLIGTVQAVCTIPGTTYAWVGSGTCTVATKNYVISLKNDACGSGCSNLLALLQAEYGDGVTLLATDTDTCMCQFQITQTSDQNCVDCAVQEYQKFTFTKPVAFRGTIWTEQAGQTGEGTGCVCGVRFESAYVSRDLKECYLQDVSYEVEPLFLYVSTNNPDFRDYSTLCNDDETFPVTLVQQAKYAQGFGSAIAEQVKQSNFYFNKPWYNDPAVRDAVGYELGVDLQGTYDQFTLVWKAPISSASNVSGFGRSQFEEYEFTIYTPQGGGAAFQNAINGWLTSVGSQPNYI
tara:strand:+ start:12004 stop:13956 length:1953 start_codon:yes stop_codon:yes gene_type:complete